MGIKGLMQQLSGPKTAQYAMWIVLALLGLVIALAFLNSGTA